jgi:hypothetical protein
MSLVVANRPHQHQTATGDSTMKSFDELSMELQQRTSTNPDFQFRLMELIGSNSRDYVMQKYPDAQPRYKTNRKGERSHVGIFLTGGVDIDEKQNYCKQQHRMQLIGTLIPYKYFAGSYFIEHNIEAWTLAAMHVRKHFNESATDSTILLFLDWLESCKMPGYPHIKPPRE